MRNQLGEQNPQSCGARSGPQKPIILPAEAGAFVVGLEAPASEGKLSTPSVEEVAVDLVEDGVILLELPCEGSVGEDHFCVVLEGKGPRVLLGRDVPGDVVKVVVECGVVEFFGVAEQCLEVALWR